MRQEKDRILELLAPLVKGVIIAMGSAQGPNGEETPVLEVLAPDGKLYFVEIANDEEGSGPGHLFIDRIPRKRPLANSTTKCEKCSSPAVIERADRFMGWIPVCQYHSDPVRKRRANKEVRKWA